MKKKNKGRQFEEIVKTTLNSGANWFSLGDLTSEDNLIEVKYTDKEGFRITKKILEKLWGEALSSNKLPLFVLGIPRNDKETFILEAKLTIKNGRI